MNILYLGLFLILGAPTKLGGTVTLEEVSFSEASQVDVEPVSNKVLLFTENLVSGKTGLRIVVSSTVKFIAVRAKNSNGIPQPVLKLSKPNTWLMEGTKGIYNIEVIEFDPEKGIEFTDITGSIGTPPTQPPTTPPTYEELAKFAKVSAIALNDKITANQLGRAYEAATLQMKGKTFEECGKLATVARFEVLNNRQGPSRKIQWNSWLNAVDKEFLKVIGNDPIKYAEALAAIAEVLQEI